MTMQFVDRAWMTTATTGTGTVTLGTAVTGYQTFAAAGLVGGNTCRYVITEGTNWEIGIGTYASSGPTLSRSPSESTSGGAAINLAGGATVFLTAAAVDIVPAGGGTFTGGVTFNAGLAAPNDGTTIDLGIAGATSLPPAILFETQANLAPFVVSRSGSTFSATLGTFFDDVLAWGFNAAQRVPSRGFFAWSMESDYCTDIGAPPGYSIHQYELHLIGQGPPFTQATLGGTVTSSDMLTLTATGAFTGSPHSVTITAGSGDTLSSLAGALALALTSDMTFKAAGFYARALGPVISIYTSIAGKTATWTKSTSGGATETITVGVGSPWTVRAVTMALDRDNGPDGNGHLGWGFVIGNSNGSSNFSVTDTGLNNLLNIGGATGYVDIGHAAPGGNLLRFMSTNTPAIQVMNANALQLGIYDGAATLPHFTFTYQDNIFIGTAGDTWIGRPRAGTLRFTGAGSGVQPHTTYHANTGVTPTLGTGGSDFGTSPSIATGSNDSTGRITVGTSPGTAGTLTFVMPWPAAPVAFANNETTNTLMRATATTTGLTISGAMSAGDKITYFCAGYGS